MPIKLCAEPRCGAEATYRGRCPDHARQTDRDTHHNKAVYNSARWKYLRRRVLFEQPLCAVEGCDEIAVDVDHITPLERGGAPFDRSNCQGLCRPHHGQKTRKEQQAWLPTP